MLLGSQKRFLGPLQNAESQCVHKNTVNQTSEVDWTPHYHTDRTADPIDSTHCHDSTPAHDTGF